MEMVEGVVNAIPILIHRSAISMVVGPLASLLAAADGVGNAIPILIHRSSTSMVTNDNERKGGQCYSHTDPSQCYLYGN